MKIALICLFLTLASAVEYSTGSHSLPLSAGTFATIEIYGPGEDGAELIGGRSGSYIKAEMLVGDLNIEITSVYSRVTGVGFALSASRSNDIVGVNSQNILINAPANPGTTAGCTDAARCNVSPCLKGCQGRPLKQQIISGSGGLAPYPISADGIIYDNPEYMIGDRYVDSVYTTVLLNCCDTIKCAYECVNGVDGGIGNGGSSSINLINKMTNRTCNGETYQPTNCRPGRGGPGLVRITLRPSATPSPSRYHPSLTPSPTATPTQIHPSPSPVHEIPIPSQVYQSYDSQLYDYYESDDDSIFGWIVVSILIVLAIMAILAFAGLYIVTMIRKHNTENIIQTDE